MGELGGAQKYLYWANRRILRWLDDSNVKIPESSQWKMTTPNFGNIFPTIELAHNEGRTTKAELAGIFQRSFAQRIVTDLSSPAPIAFASGTGPITFGEFISLNGVPERALMYINVPVERGDAVAVCLFGSMENYAEFVIEAGTHRGGGWTASSAGDIERFLSTGQFKNGVICDSREDIAREAVKVCCGQGETGPGPDKPKGYNRNFTYGETGGDCEWCAEIFCDVDLSADELGPECGHSRVLIGAPLWVRTPTLRSIYLYTDYSKDELAEIDEKSNVVTLGGRLKRAVGWRGRGWMDRLVSRDRVPTSSDDQPSGDRPNHDHKKTVLQNMSDELDVSNWTRPLLNGEDIGWPRDWAAGNRLERVWIESDPKSDLHMVIIGLFGYLDRKLAKWEYTVKCLQDESVIPEGDTQYLRHLQDQGKPSPIEAAEDMVRVYRHAQKLIDDLCRRIERG